MVGIKKLSILLSSLLVVGVVGGCSTSKPTSASNGEKSKDKVLKIGITQILEHDALDAARKGFIKALEDKNYKDGSNIKIDFQNAQNDMPTTQTIAEKFVNDNVDLILAIATPSAQAAFNATQKAKKDIPILITAVTDPVDAGLVKSLEKSENNVTGTSDAFPIDKQFDLIKKLVPQAKRVGMIYNTSEANSGLQVEEAKKAATNFGFEIVASGITSSNEIPQALSAIQDKIDVLYIPTDNMVAAAAPTITNILYAKNIPVFGSELGQVKGGAVGTAGMDYYKLGYETGLKAVEVLEGKKPSEIPVTILKESSIAINEDAVKKLNIKVPDDINSIAEKITGGVK
jgi:putative ABC transport system substrate-binding protein